MIENSLKIENWKLKIMRVRFNKKSIIIAIMVCFILVSAGFALNGWFSSRVPADTMTRGLVGYWSFDEGTGTTTYDASENGNNGTIYQVAGEGESGPPTSVYVVPTGTGNYSTFAASGGGAHYLLVDDPVGSPDTNTWVVAQDDTDTRDSYTFSAGLSASTTINYVQIYVRWIRDGGYATDTFAPFYRSGSNYDGTYMSATPTSWTTVTYNAWKYTQNPSTSATWTVAAVNAMEWGLVYGPVGWNYNQITQFYTEVNYSTSSVSVGNDGAQWTNGKSAGALEFDGVDDYVDMGDIGSVQTIEFWINNGTTTAGILELVNNTTYLSVSSDVISATGFTSASIYINGKATSTLSSGWNHVVVTDTSAVSATGFLVGEANSDFMEGAIDEVRAYDRALSVQEIRYHYNRGGPAGHWKFDEGAGTTAYDSTGNDNDGTLYGGMATSTSVNSGWQAGKYGSALKFDGSNDYVTIPNITGLLDGTTEGTISVWVKTAALSSAQHRQIAGWRDNADTDFYILHLQSSDNLELRVRTSSGNWDLTPSFANYYGRWTHIVFVRKGSTAKAYFNGKEVASRNDVAGNWGVSNNFTVGAYPGGGSNRYDGFVDDVRIYDYAKSADEIKLDYNAGFAALFGPQTGCDDDPGACVTNGLVGYWSFDEGNGTTTYDASGNGNDGTIYQEEGDATSSTSSVNLYPNSAGYYSQWEPFGGSTHWQLVSDSSSSTYLQCGTSTLRDSWGFQDLDAGLASSTINYLQLRLTLRTEESGGTTDDLVYPFYRTASTNYTNGTGQNPSNGPTWYNYALANWRYTQNPSTSATWTVAQVNAMEWGVQWIYVSDYWGDEINTFEVEVGYTSSSVEAGNDGAQWASGKFGTGLDFDGTDDYVSVATSSSLDITGNQLTLETWIKVNATTGSNQMLFDKFTYQSVGYGLWLSSDLKPYYNIISSSGNKEGFITDTPLDLDTWYHLVLVYGSPSLKAYINGVNVYSTGFTGNILSSPDGLYVGAEYGGSMSNFFDGQIDDFRIYNRALSVEEVRYHYNGGGPVGHWKLDEGSGSTAYDSGNPGGNNGTLYGGMATSTSANSGWKSGKYGGALAFDGTNDYINLGDQDILNFSGTQPFTISAWVRPDKTASTGRILARYNSGVAGQYVFGVTSGLITFNREVSPYTITGSTLPINEWSHVVAVYDGSKMSIYVNGILDAGPTLSGSIADNSIDVHIGSDLTSGSASNFFEGLIDDVRVYNYARTPVQIRQDYNAGFAALFGPQTGCDDDPGACMTSGLIGYWNFEEGSGQFSYDNSDNSNNGQLGSTTAADAGDPQWTTGKVGGALKFDGSNDYVDMGTDSSLNITNAITVEAWVNPDDFDADMGIVGKQNMPGSYWKGWDLSLRRSSHATHPYSFDFIIGDGSTGHLDAYSDFEATSSQWVHVAVTWNGSKIIFYINGVAETPQTYSTFDNSAVSAKIGKSSYSGYHDGLLDEIRVYNRALSAAEIRYHYNKGGPVAHWKFNEGEGATAYDSTDNDNDGTLYGGMATSTSANSGWKSGKYGGALKFDGSNDYISLSDDDSLDISNGMTVEAWINPSSYLNTTSHQQDIVYQAAWPSAGWYLQVREDSEKLLFMSLDGSAHSVSSLVTIPLNQWTHVVGWSDGTTNKVYVNGIERGSASSGTLTDSSASLYISSSNSDYDWDGLIDDVRIYNYPRTPEQIFQDYNAGYNMYFR